MNLQLTGSSDSDPDADEGACSSTAACKLPCTWHHIKHNINCNIIRTRRRSAAHSRYTPSDTLRNRSASRLFVAPVVVIPLDQPIDLVDPSDAVLVPVKDGLRMSNFHFDRMSTLLIN